MSAAVSIRIPELLAKRLDRFARKTKEPQSFVIQKVLDNYSDLQPAMDRLRDKVDAIITSDEMRKSLGL
jgi:predicted transcriptional regulator